MSNRCYVMVMLALSALVATKASADINAGLVALWTFDTDMTDSAGHNDLTSHGSPILSSGMLSKALEVNGSNQYVEADDFVYSTTPITVSAWAYLAPSTNTGTGGGSVKSCVNCFGASCHSVLSRDSRFLL